VQRELVPSKERRNAESAFERCRLRLEDFHQDLSNIIERDLPLILGRSSVPQPRFVAEFSDSAYIVGDRFASVAIPALFLMRRALRHRYPLRGGIGVGSFSHETSGVRTSRDGQIWSTGSFLGGAIVTAYQAERSTTPGLRILVHPQVMQRNQEGHLNVYTMSLPKAEASDSASHELRFWTADETSAATKKLRAFLDAEQPPQRAVRHYEAAISAYQRFGTVKKRLPHAVPALWLFR
jgi:hypothetical protein